MPKTGETVYVVAGYMRSGTSMMMKCLEAGGMRAAYSPGKDRTLDGRYARKDYRPNPGGFYELGPAAFRSPEFPKAYSRKLIKVPHWRLAGLPPFGYKILFMLRDPQEIEVSYLRMFRRRPPFVIYKYQELVDRIFERMAARGDIETTPVHYREVICEPLTVFKRIRENNWPVEDVEKAAAAVDPALYRSRGGDLEKVRQSIPGLRTDLPDGLKARRKRICDLR